MFAAVMILSVLVLPQARSLSLLVALIIKLLLRTCSYHCEECSTLLCCKAAAAAASTTQQNLFYLFFTGEISPKNEIKY
jgi:hypothetical protein